MPCVRLRKRSHIIRLPDLFLGMFHIRQDSRYEAVGRVLYALQRGGIVKVGFLTEPDHGVRGVRQ